MYVPRFGETNIVYDVISGNNILTTTTNKIYGIIEIQDGILTHSNEESNFNSPTGIIYGSDTGGKWSLASTDITNGILTKSNDLTFDSHTGLLYGKSTGKQTWSLDSVVIDKGILTKSNNTLGFNSLTGILYGSATTATGEWSLESTKITDGIFTRSNNTLVFNNPNGLLYGSIKDDVWSLNNVNNINYVDNTDYVLYYVKSNDGSITPQWKVLTINGKNFEQGQGENVKHQWRNMEINENDKLVLNKTEYLKDQDYGVFNCNGTVMPLTTKVLNDIGLKLFSPSEINEVGYVTTNVILYNSSMDNVSLPVNYYGVLNFHSQNLPNKYSNEDIKSTMLNLIYTKGFYNYTTISNNLPIYEQIKTTYDGFYNYLETNLKNNTSDNYLHFTTTLNVDSIIMPKTNNNFYTIVNDNSESYSIDKIKNYKIVIGIYTNFNKVQENTFYQNTFFCNSTTQVLSFNNTDVLLGYLIIDLANIDNTTHKVNINQLLDIDSTIPYNTNINNLTAEQLKNYVLSFRPLFYINNNNDNTIHSLYYNSNISIIGDINFSNFNEQHITINNAELIYNTDYVYYNNCIRFFNDITSDINTNKLYQNTTLVIPSYGYTINNISSEDQEIIEGSIKNTYTYYTITATLNDLYYDTKPDDNDPNKKNIYFIDNSLQAYSYISSTTSTIIYTSQLLGYIYSNNSIYHAIFNTDPKCLSHQSLILSTKYYTKKDKDIIIIDNNQTIEIFKNNDMYSDENAIYISIDPTKCNIDGYNNLIYDNVNFSYNTYILNKYIQIDKSIVYIDTSSNVYILANNNNTVSEVAVKTSINNTDTIIEILYTNNLYILKCKYECDRLYRNLNNRIVGKQLFLCNDDYIFHKELTIRSDILKYTTQGVSYNGNFIFNKDDVSMNILGQIIVNTDKYYYRDNAIYNDFTDYKVLEATNEIQINYREYIEVTNSNFNVLHNEFIIGGGKKDIYSLCKPLKYFNNITITQNADDAKTFYFDLKNYVKGDIDYGDDCILLNVIGDSFGASITGNNILLGPCLKDYSTFNSLSRVLTFETNTRSESDSIIHTKQGLSITTNSEYMTSIRNISDVIYTNDYIDVPFFDTPIEKDIQIVLKPISKYSIISYNRKPDNKSTYTLAKNVGFKISLCNIYVTLTSYIGEYPSMIN